MDNLAHGKELVARERGRRGKGLERRGIIYGFELTVLGFKPHGSGLRVDGSGLRVSDLGFKV